MWLGTVLMLLDLFSSKCASIIFNVYGFKRAHFLANPENMGFKGGEDSSPIYVALHLSG